MKTSILGRLMFLVYIILSIAALAIWMPKFFMINLQTKFDWQDYRYWMMTGIPIGLFLISVIAVQAVLRRFSLMLFLQVLLVAGSWVLGFIAFEYLRQANFFCLVHVWATLLFSPWNLRWYYKELEIIDNPPEPKKK